MIFPALLETIGQTAWTDGSVVASDGRIVYRRTQKAGVLRAFPRDGSARVRSVRLKGLPLGGSSVSAGSAWILEGRERSRALVDLADGSSVPLPESAERVLSELGLCAVLEGRAGVWVVSNGTDGDGPARQPSFVYSGGRWRYAERLPVPFETGIGDSYFVSYGPERSLTGAVRIDVSRIAAENGQTVALTDEWRLSGPRLLSEGSFGSASAFYRSRLLVWWTVRGGIKVTSLDAASGNCQACVLPSAAEQALIGGRAYQANSSELVWTDGSRHSYRVRLRTSGRWVHGRTLRARIRLIGV